MTTLVPVKYIQIYFLQLLTVGRVNLCTGMYRTMTSSGSIQWDIQKGGGGAGTSGVDGTSGS